MVSYRSDNLQFVYCHLPFPPPPPAVNNDHSRKLSISQRQGLITLIPKKGKDLLKLKNWRPLTLLNQDYKLASKAIASRIKAHLEKLISSDQTGFVPGRLFVKMS